MKRKKHKRHAPGLPKLDPQQQAMLEEAQATASAMCCPIAITEDLHHRAQDLAGASEAAARLAELARAKHPSAPEVFPAALTELAALLTRHKAELDALVAKLAPLGDHDVEHQHLEPSEELFMSTVKALFGDMPDGDDAEA